jgi:hypothetical protein
MDQPPVRSPAKSPSGMSHREALTKGLEDFQRMLTEVRQSNSVLTEQLKQFEGSLDDVRATNEHLGRQLTDFGDRLQLAKKEEDEIASELKRFSERLAVAKANLEGDLFRTTTSAASMSSPAAQHSSMSTPQGPGLSSGALSGTPAAAPYTGPDKLGSTVLSVNDLAGGDAQAAQKCRDLLNKNYESIKWIHSRYSVVGEIALDNVFTVTKLQFWRLACDTGVLAKGAPRGQVDAIFNASVQSLGLSEQISMTLPAFMEGLIRLAAMKYSSGPLDARVSDFLARDLLPIADKMTDPLRDLLARPGAQAVFNRHRERLLGIFKYYAKTDTSTPDALARQTTMNIREFITLLRECDVIDRQLSVQAIMETFVQSQVEEGEHGEENLDSEFIFGEFLEAFARCADIKINARNRSLPEKMEEFMTNMIFPVANTA